MGQQWNRLFEKSGKIFIEIQKDMPKISRLFKRRGVKRVLDLGCGSGRHTVYLSKQGFEVYGIDIAPIGIKITKDWLKKDRLRANLKIGSIYKKLPYKDNFFDAIVSTQVIHHAKIETIRKTIKEIERILKYGGLIFITVRMKKQMRGKARYKIIAPRTYIPIEGDESGLIHYRFNEKILKKEFKNFKSKVWTEPNLKHYCLLGELKSKNL